MRKQEQKNQNYLRKKKSAGKPISGKTSTCPRNNSVVVVTVEEGFKVDKRTAFSLFPVEVVSNS